MAAANATGSPAMAAASGEAGSPSMPLGVVTTALPWLHASTIFNRVPLPSRIGATTTAASCSTRVMSASWPQTSTPGVAPASCASIGGIRAPTQRSVAVGTHARTAGHTERSIHSAPRALGP